MTRSSSWESAGIHINETTSTFDTVIGNATACTPGPSCTWEFEDWAGSWVYSPDIYPTGEELFSTGAVANYGSYSNPQADNFIKADGLHQRLARQLREPHGEGVPVIYLPDQVQSLTETQNNLRGVVPQNPLSTHHPGELVLREVAVPGRRADIPDMGTAPAPRSYAWVGAVPR